MLELSAFGIFSLWFGTVGVVNGEDALWSGASGWLIGQEVQTDLVELVNVPVGLREKVLEFLVIGVSFSGDSDRFRRL